MLLKANPKKFYNYPQGGGKGAGAAAGFAKGVNFNGSTYVTSGGAGVATSNGKSYLLSVWFRQTAAPSSYVIWIENAGGVGGFSIQRDGSGTFSVYGQDSASLNVATITLGSNPVSDTNWHHLVCTANATTVVYQTVLDGVLLTTSFGNTSANNINFAAGTAVTIGGRGGSLNPAADIAELYVAHNQSSLDLSVPANVQKFRSTAGHPVDLGAAGATPTGTAPTMYFSVRNPSGVATDFLTNRGTGGATWTVGAGALGIAGVDP